MSHRRLVRSMLHSLDSPHFQMIRDPALLHIMIDDDHISLSVPTWHIPQGFLLLPRLSLGKNATRPVTTIVVSHDTAFLDKVCSHVINVKQRKSGFSVSFSCFFFRCGQTMRLKMASFTGSNCKKIKRCPWVQNPRQGSRLTRATSQISSEDVQKPSHYLSGTWTVPNQKCRKYCTLTPFTSLHSGFSCEWII